MARAREQAGATISTYSCDDLVTCNARTGMWLVPEFDELFKLRRHIASVPKRNVTSVDTDWHAYRVKPALTASFSEHVLLEGA